MAKVGVLPPGKRFQSFSDFLTTVLGNVEFGPLDYALLAAIAGLFLALVVAEFRGGCLSGPLRRVFKSEGRTIALLAAGSFAAVRYYFGSGEFSWGADQPIHICFAHMASLSISEGELPIWTNYLGAGTPYLQFYGFLFFYFTGLIDQLWKEVFLSLKVAMGVLHVASGVAMYLLARTLTGSRRAGFIAGLAYVLSFWHTQQVIIMGRFPLSLFYALLPLPFYFFERLSSPGPAAVRERLANSLAGGICLGALILTHPGYGFWAAVLLGVYVGLRLSILRRENRSRGNLVWWSALLLAGGLVFGGTWPFRCGSSASIRDSPTLSIFPRRRSRPGSTCWPGRTTASGRSLRPTTGTADTSGCRWSSSLPAERGPLSGAAPGSWFSGFCRRCAVWG